MQLGYEALPFIRKLYDENNSDDFELSIVQGYGLIGAVRNIIGDDFKIPESIRGNILKIKNYTKEWLDENMHRYLKHD